MHDGLPEQLIGGGGVEGIRHAADGRKSTFRFLPKKPEYQLATGKPKKNHNLILIVMCQMCRWRNKQMIEDFNMPGPMLWIALPMRDQKINERIERKEGNRYRRLHITSSPPATGPPARALHRPDH